MQVLVTGASGKTGAMVVRKLLERGSHKVRALVRSDEAENALKEKLGERAGSVEIVRGDVMVKDSLVEPMKNVEKLMIVTSSAPQVDKLSLVKVIGLKVATLGQVSTKPDFWFHEGQYPEHVDWVGQRNQIDVAKDAGVKHVVLVSSMVGTLPDHFLNVKCEKMVLWKRKSEKYLIASGLPYTILHPGGLLPHPGPKANVPVPGGKRQIHLDVDDKMVLEGEKLAQEGKMEEARNRIPREDLAEILVQCLDEPDAVNRSFDIGAGEEGRGTVYDGNFKALLATLDGKNCSYDIGPELPESEL